MSDSEKPFACSSPGCNMSFTNEDHLVVHKKKHDMILNLGAAGKSGIFIADQTPTPTRFIRNCEEVGLFQDLQNVNPFEETFRRAVEGKIGTLPECEIDANDDTLHTPHVFPLINNSSTDNITISHVHTNDVNVTSSVMNEGLVCNTKNSNSSNNNSINIHNNNNNIIMNNNNDKKNKNVEKSICSNSTNDTMIVEKVKKTTETIVIQEADTSIIPQTASSPASSTLSINGEEVQLLLKTQDGTLLKLSAIPISDSSTSIKNLQSQQSTPQMIIINAALPLKSHEISPIKKSTSSPQLSLAKMKLRQALVKNGVNTSQIKVQNENSIIKKSMELDETKVIKTDNYIDLNRKQDILARNRASSMRSRAKRKEWINQLQKSVNEANEINTKLQEEVNALRSEVTRLKTILHAHKDCPVTRAMEKDNRILVDSKIVPLPSSRFIQAASIHQSNVDHLTTINGIKRTIITNNNESSIAVKKPQLIPSSSKLKHSILLPKSSNEKTAIPVITKIVDSSLNSACITGGGGGGTTLKILDLGHIVNEKRGGKPIFIVHNSPQKKMQVINSRQIVQVDQSLQLINAASKSTGT